MVIVTPTKEILHVVNAKFIRNQMGGTIDFFEDRTRDKWVCTLSASGAIIFSSKAEVESVSWTDFYLKHNRKEV